MTVFEAAIIKGIKEHKDSTYYFGSTGAFAFYKNLTIKNGYITEDEKLTELGLKMYIEKKLYDYPETRATHWDYH